jgi:hypothetical protein
MSPLIVASPMSAVARGINVLSEQTVSYLVDVGVLIKAPWAVRNSTGDVNEPTANAVHADKISTVWDGGRFAAVNGFRHRRNVACDNVRRTCFGAKLSAGGTDASAVIVDESTRECDTGWEEAGIQSGVVPGSGCLARLSVLRAPLC